MKFNRFRLFDPEPATGGEGETATAQAQPGHTAAQPGQTGEPVPAEEKADCAGGSAADDGNAPAAIAGKGVPEAGETPGKTGDAVPSGTETEIDEASFKKKYDLLKQEFDAYRAEVNRAADRAVRESAFRKVLETAGIAHRYIDTVLRASDLGGLVFDEAGSLQDADALVEKARGDWADFIATSEVRGAAVANPPLRYESAGEIRSLAEALHNRMDKKG